MFDTLPIKVTGAERISVPTAAGILTNKPCQLLVYLNTQHRNTPQQEIYDNTTI